MSDELVKRARDCANGVGDMKTDRGDLGVFDDLADEIIRLKAELEAAKKQARMEALREVLKLCAEYEEGFERLNAQGAAHGAGTCFKAVQSLTDKEEV